MRHIYIDASDHFIDTSGVILGTANFESADREELAHKVYDRYVERGGLAFDLRRGVGEEIFGRWLKGRSGRDRLTVITKGGRCGVDMATCRESLKEDIEASLTALGTHIDLYMPGCGFDYPDALLETLDEYVRSGDIRAVGAANRTLGLIDEVNRVAFERGLPSLVASSVQWSLAVVDRDALREAFGEGCVGLNADGEYSGYRHRDTLLLAYSALAWGYFCKRIWGETPRFADALDGEENEHRLALVRRWSEKTGRSPAEISLAYVLSHPEINAAAVVAVESLKQLEELMRVGDYLLPYEFFEELGEVAVRV